MQTVSSNKCPVLDFTAGSNNRIKTWNIIKNEKKTHLMEATFCLFISKEKHSEKLRAYFTINHLL